MKSKLLTAFLIIPLLISFSYSIAGDTEENQFSEKDFQKIYSKANFACWVIISFKIEGEDASNVKTQAVLNNDGSCFAINFDSKTYIVTSAHLNIFNPETALNFINENMVVNPALRWTKISSITILKTFVVFKSTNDISLANAPEDINSLNASALIPVKFEKIDYNADLAQLKPINQTDYQKIKGGNLGDSDKLLIGEKVMAIGNPLGHTFVASWGQITHFHIEKIKNKISRHIYTSEMVGFGNSGGPLLNQKGEVIGICKSAYFINPHFSVFIPSNAIKDYLEKNK